MTEHKFTDEEIIKALESKAEAHCSVCETKEIVPCEHCVFHYIKNGVDLINRQKAEISVLTSAVDNSTQEFLKLHDTYQEQKAEVAYWQDEAANAKKEAVGAFAERLKKYYASLGGKTAAEGVEYHVDQIAREVLAREEKEGE